MKIISHRGFANGIDKSIENKPSEIESRIIEGFDVEIDLWVVNSKLWLGHDEGVYKVDIDWLLEFSNFLWIHCKSSESLNFLSSNKFKNLNYFFHDTDQYTITSRGYVWCYPGADIINNSVYLFPEKFTLSSSTIIRRNLSICTDFPNIYRDKL